MFRSQTDRLRLLLLGRHTSPLPDPIPHSHQPTTRKEDRENFTFFLNSTESFQTTSPVKT